MHLGFDQDVWIGVQVDAQSNLSMVSLEPPHAAASTSLAVWGPGSSPDDKKETAETCGLQRASARTHMVPGNADLCSLAYGYVCEIDDKDL